MAVRGRQKAGFLTISGGRERKAARGRQPPFARRQVRDFGHTHADEQVRNALRHRGRAVLAEDAVAQLAQ